MCLLLSADTFREAAASYVLFEYLNGIVGDRKQRVYFI